ncbi:MAG: hypothetical protein ACI8UD_001501 [Planctomycetota bacterium]|jgi:hypothetical protein
MIRGLFRLVSQSIGAVRFCQAICRDADLQVGGGRPSVGGSGLSRIDRRLGRYRVSSARNPDDIAKPPAESTHVPGHCRSLQSRRSMDERRPRTCQPGPDPRCGCPARFIHVTGVPRNRLPLAVDAAGAGARRNSPQVVCGSESKFAVPAKSAKPVCTEPEVGKVHRFYVDVVQVEHG